MEKRKIPLTGFPGLTKDAKIAMVSQFLGFGMDAYDLALVVTLAPVLSHVFVTPTGSAAWQYLVILLTYSITMFVRPLGAAIFGHYADRIGRRRIFLITMAGVGVVTGATAFLPTYAEVGVWAWVLFATMRLIMGIFMGGETAAGHTFTMELAPKDIRGRVAGIIQSGYPFGYMLSTLVFAAFSSVMSKEAMISVGWRYVFLTGLAPVAVALAVRLFLPESPLFKQVKEKGELEKHPFLSLFKPPIVWGFLTLLILMTGLILTDYTIYSYIPYLLTLQGRGFDYTTYALIYAFSLAVTVFGYWFYGWITDFVGRRRFTILWSIYVIIASFPALYLLYTSAIAHSIVLALIATTITCSLKFTWGMIPAWLAENFPTKRRASGVGFGYTGGMLLGSWYSVYIWWIHCIPQIQAIEGEIYLVSPAIVMVIGGIITLITMYFMPDRTGIDLAEIKE